ncbi:hypothetical protein BDN67DRAFT_572900 [Paxillus ammoniavirescens]|nr:hypothetical protein BDN67DRAFT_572900 [Paxillus ammoniavirescens]
MRARSASLQFNFALLILVILSGVGFPTSLPSSPTATPTIVHLSIRPYAPPSEDPALSKKKRLSTAFGRRGTNGDVEDTSGDDAERAGCCGGCVIC